MQDNNVASSTELQQEDTEMEPTEDQEVFGDTDFVGGESLRWKAANYLISTLEFCRKRIRNRKLSGAERAKWGRIGTDVCKVILFSNLTKGGIARTELSEVRMTDDEDDSKALVLMDSILRRRMRERNHELGKRADYNLSK